MAAILVGFAVEVAKGAWTDPVRLEKLGAIVPVYIAQGGEYWRLLSAMFLHGDGTKQGTLLHLAVNLFSLYNLGTLYEYMFSTRRFVLIYFVTGIAASLTSFMRLPPFGASVGASGAIFGILGAFILSVWRSPRYRDDHRARSMMKQAIFWMIANIVIGLQIAKIDNAAHIGGLVAGMLLGALLPHAAPPPGPPAEVVIDVRPSATPGADPGARRDDR
ncbi:MAG TPA: rhomboid family intramembrane serine protease [Thermoanaerobaculia bacterium]|nr:rhomboid family intramembrane serine protease [Thermoanaerobaculia bacterium]